MVNKFVAAFTPAESSAVLALREKLPDITKQASAEDTQTPPVQLWGIVLEKESKDERLDVVLIKFLRARNLDVDASAKLLSASIAWRKEFKTDTILSETFPEGKFDGVGFIHKKDREGRPVCYNVYGDINLESVFSDVDMFVRWRVQLMEKGIQNGIDFVEVDSMIQVHDYKNVSLFGSRNANSKLATKKVIAILQDNYPEFLARKFFVNIPWWGASIFRLLRPLLSESTVQKFIVCSSETVKSDMTQLIDEDSLPVQYGGTSVVPGQPTTEANKNTDKVKGELDVD